MAKLGMVLGLWMFIGMGCTFSGGDIVLPDIANLSIQSISTFVPGDSVRVVVSSTSLTPGQYEVYYSLTGANVLSGQITYLNIQNDSCSFYTPALANAGITTLTITEVINSSGGVASTNAAKSFSDSDGVMTAAISLPVPQFDALDVTATLSGTALTVKGNFWTSKAAITINIKNYTAPGGVYALNTAGGAVYTTSGGADSSAYGTVTITPTARLLTGTFAFTTRDSLHISNGTFSCALP